MNLVSVLDVMIFMTLSVKKKKSIFPPSRGIIYNSLLLVSSLTNVFFTWSLTVDGQSPLSRVTVVPYSFHFGKKKWISAGCSELELFFFFFNNQTLTEGGMVAQHVALLSDRCTFLRLILYSSYCLCGVLQVLPMSLCGSFRFSSLLAAPKLI